MTTREALIAARELIEDPERWTQEESARDADGKGVPIGSPEACQWCAMGALSKIAPDGLMLSRTRVALLRGTGTYSVSMFNDAPGRTHAEVLAAFDKAIAECKS